MEFENHPVEWNNTGTEPPKELKDNGFVAGYKPPAGIFNRIFNKLYLCIIELQNKLKSYVASNDANIANKAEKDHDHDIATQDKNGFISKEDKAKLDELSSGGGGGGGTEDYLELKNRPNIFPINVDLSTLPEPKYNNVKLKRGILYLMGKDAEDPKDMFRQYRGVGIVIGSCNMEGITRATNFLAIGRLDFVGAPDPNDDSNFISVGINSFNVSTRRSIIVGNLNKPYNVEDSSIIGDRITFVRHNTWPDFGGKASYSSIIGKDIEIRYTLYSSLIVGRKLDLIAPEETQCYIDSSIISGEACGMNDESFAMHTDLINGIIVGRNCHAGGFQAAAFGLGTLSFSNTFALGKYNKRPVINLPSDLFIIGNGSSSSSRSNAFRVNTDGQAYATGAFNATGADYAECFEWIDGNPDLEDRRGRFVTLDGEKIRLANFDDDYIVGVISATPSVVGDNYADDWQGKYECDVFGKRVSNEGEWKYSQEYDADKDSLYVPRMNRPEWAAVGMVGKLIVVDDSTCEVNGFCYPSKDGIASKSERGYRVMARVDDNHIKIVLGGTRW